MAVSNASGGRIATPRGRVAIALAAVALMAGCADNLDWDLRSPSLFSTAPAARQAQATRPQPDARGIITYPGYQVVVAQRGERVRDVAARLGIDATTLARHNAIDPDAVLRGGETLVLPGAAAGAPLSATGGPIAVTPIDGASAAAQPGPEPIRHQVRRGETAFTIARLYNVSARTIADWNGLPADLSVREGQILMIPAPQSISQAAGDTRTAGLPAATAEAVAETPSAPGRGSPTPPPPSAAQPLPDERPAPVGTTAPGTTTQPPVADMAAQRTQGARLAMPVEGRIIRAYARGRNDGIGIGAPAGTEVRAAAAGTVAAITRDTDQVPILVIRHDDNLLTVYANIDNIRVERGARVTRGQPIAVVRRGDPSFLHFEVREGFDSVDPMPYLQ